LLVGNPTAGRLRRLIVVQKNPVDVSSGQERSPTNNKKSFAYRMINKMILHNISVEFLKQVEISGKQPYFLPNFSEQNHSPKNLSSNESPPIRTLLPHLFF
jgi:hypothetical protein